MHLLRHASCRPALAIGLALLASGCGTRALAGEETFFAGKTIRIVVGYPPGGGYDLHARLLARHLSRHVPGAPAVWVENMPGAGGLVAARYLARVAAADGLTIGLLSQASVLASVTGVKDVDIDPREFEILGSPAALSPVCLFSRASGIVDVDAWRAAQPPPRIGTSGPGGTSFVTARILARTLDLPMRQVTGYSGTADMRHALDSREIDGVCTTWEGIEKRMQAGQDLVAVLRLGPARFADVERAPDAITLVTLGAKRALLTRSIYDLSATSRFYAVPPHVPASRVEVLREALAGALADPGLVREARDAALLIAPVAGKQIHEAIDRLLGDRVTVEDMRRALASE